MCCFLRTEKIERGIVVVASGSIYGDSSDFSKVLSKAVDEKPELLILDLTKVDVIFSMGITDIVRSFTQLRSDNHQLVLVGVQDNVKKIFRLLGIEKIIPMTENIEEALKQ